MSYWWRLYAHLAPHVPDSPILQRVEADARTDAPEPDWVEFKLPVGEPHKTMRRMYSCTDEDELKILSEDLEFLVGLYAKKNDWTLQKAFTASYTKAGKLTREDYIRIFRFYKKPKLKKGPYRDLATLDG